MGEPSQVLRERLQDRFKMARGVLDREGHKDVAVLVPIEEVLIWLDEIETDSLAAYSEGLDAATAGTSEETFQMAGGFSFTDELVIALADKWRESFGKAVVISSVDLGWLLDGYSRARKAMSE